MQGISTLLANNVRWRGAPAWQAFLAEQREQSLLRDARIGELLRRVDAATARRGIACVGLKGAAFRTLDLYRPANGRWVTSICSCSPDDLPAIAVVMRDLGYVEAFMTEQHVYEPT